MTTHRRYVHGVQAHAAPQTTVGRSVEAAQLALQALSPQLRLALWHAWLAALQLSAQGPSAEQLIVPPAQNRLRLPGSDPRPVSQAHADFAGPDVFREVDATDSGSLQRDALQV